MTGRAVGAVVVDVTDVRADGTEDPFGPIVRDLVSAAFRVAASPYEHNGANESLTSLRDTVAAGPGGFPPAPEFAALVAQLLKLVNECHSVEG